MADTDLLDTLSVDELAELYDSEMLRLIDKHCPAVNTRRKFGPLTPWFDADCRASRRWSRMLERRYRRTQSDADRLEWIQQLKVMHQLYEGKNHQHWRLRIADSKGSMKKLWRTLSSVLGTTRSSAASLRHNADDFAKFFSEKVCSIRASTASSKPHSDQITTGPSCHFNIWTSVSPGDIEKLIGIANNKTCQLDPALTWLVKECGGLV